MFLLLNLVNAQILELRNEVVFAKVAVHTHISVSFFGFIVGEWRQLFCV